MHLRAVYSNLFSRPTTSVAYTMYYANVRELFHPMRIFRIYTVLPVTREMERRLFTFLAVSFRRRLISYSLSIPLHSHSLSSSALSGFPDAPSQRRENDISLCLVLHARRFHSSFVEYFCQLRV